MRAIISNIGDIAIAGPRQSLSVPLDILNRSFVLHTHAHSRTYAGQSFQRASHSSGGGIDSSDSSMSDTADTRQTELSSASSSSGTADAFQQRSVPSETVYASSGGTDNETVVQQERPARVVVREPEFVHIIVHDKEPKDNGLDPQQSNMLPVKCDSHIVGVFYSMDKARKAAFAYLERCGLVIYENQFWDDREDEENDPAYRQWRDTLIQAIDWYDEGFFQQQADDPDGFNDRIVILTRQIGAMDMEWYD